ncbi:hypothetical protein ACWKTZ_23060 [Bacillus cereus]
MRNVGDEIVALKYESLEIQKLIRRFKKTKKKRIKNKIFKILFPLCIKEKQVIKLDDVVLMKYDIFKELIEMRNELEHKCKEFSIDL